MQSDSIGEATGKDEGEAPADIAKQARTSEEPKYSVFRVNPAEWWAAASLAEAIEGASVWHDIPESEIVDELAPPYELTPEEMVTSLVSVQGVAVPFMFELDRLVRAGAPFPRPFGTAAA